MEEMSPPATTTGSSRRRWVNVPINDQWQFRPASSASNSDGYNNSLSTGRRTDGEGNQSYRTKRRYRPTQALDAILSVNWSKDSPYGNTRKLLPAAGHAGMTVGVPTRRPRRATPGEGNFC